MGLCSYAANACLYTVNQALQSSIPEGKSNTIAFAGLLAVRATCTGSMFSFKIENAAKENIELRSLIFRCDIVPVSNGTQTVGSVRGKTFQTKPRLNNYDPSIPQTPHVGGI